MSTTATIVALPYPRHTRVPSVVAEPRPVYQSPTQFDATEFKAIELDAVELHRRLCGLQRLSDRARLEYLRIFATIDRDGRYVELGYSSTVQYLVREFRLGRSSAAELLRVCRRLDELPVLTRALGDGEMRWSTLKTVSRVATTATEAEWRDYAATHTLEQTQHEVKRAIAERRDRPSESEYGLANLTSRVSFELSLEAKERFQTAMARVADSMGDAAPRDLASIVTFLSQQILEGQEIGKAATDSPGVYNVDSAPPANPVAPGLTVVYRRCPTCAVSTVDSAEGPVAVAPEVIDRIADVACTVTITDEELSEADPLPDGALDAPNSPALAHKVRVRDGQRCANPGCNRRHALQAHHIRFRSDGGRTVLANEVALCRGCHTLVHGGLLRIGKASDGTLTWTPKLHDLGPLPPFAPCDLPPPTRESLPQDGGHDLDLDALADGLVSLGYNKKDAHSRIDAAVDAWQAAESSGEIDEATLLSAALRVPA
ncbi:MAG: HNH endonuclease signature motif containing protein [Planctomycetota bacterium]